MFHFSNLLGARPTRPVWGLPSPDGLTHLSVTGAICWPNSGDEMHLDAPLLRSFRTRTVVTTTDFPGSVGPQIFKGAALMDVLRAAGWRGADVTFHASDGSSSHAKLSQLREAGGVIATTHNNLPMQCTRYAPVWLVFPFDTAPDRLTRRALTNISIQRLVSIEID